MLLWVEKAAYGLVRIIKTYGLRNTALNYRVILMEPKRIDWSDQEQVAERLRNAGYPEIPEWYI